MSGEHRNVAPVYPPPTLVERSLDLLFPPLCVECRKIGRWVCSRCWHSIDWLLNERCGRCGKPSAVNPCPGCARAGSAPSRVLAVAHFGAVTRNAVHALKYENRYAIAPTLGRLMAEAMRHGEADLAAHVALHPIRRRERGYDQALMLAKHAARNRRIPLAPRLVSRIRKTAQQALLDPAGRRANVQGAFAVQARLHGERVLLIDDVYTTGATLSAAGDALLEAGAGEVIGLVFAVAQVGRDNTADAAARSQRGDLPL